MKFTEEHYRKFAKKCYKKLNGVVNTIIPCAGLVFTENGKFLAKTRSKDTIATCEFKIQINLHRLIEISDDDKEIKSRIIGLLVHELSHMDQSTDITSMYINKETGAWSSKTKEDVDELIFEGELANDCRTFEFTSENTVLMHKLFADFTRYECMFPYILEYQTKNNIEGNVFNKINEISEKYKYKKINYINYYLYSIEYYLLHSIVNNVKQENILLYNMVGCVKNVDLIFPDEKLSIKFNDTWICSIMNKFNKAMFRWTYEWRNVIENENCQLNVKLTKPDDDTLCVRFALEEKKKEESVK